MSIFSAEQRPAATGGHCRARPGGEPETSRAIGAVLFVRAPAASGESILDRLVRAAATTAAARSLRRHGLGRGVGRRVAERGGDRVVDPLEPDELEARARALRDVLE